MAGIPLVFSVRGGIGCLVENYAILDTFVLEVALEELQAHQGKDTQAEDGEDGHVCQLPHGVDQGPNNDLQSCGKTTVRRPCEQVPHRASACPHTCTLGCHPLNTDSVGQFTNCQAAPSPVPPGNLTVSREGGGQVRLLSPCIDEAPETQRCVFHHAAADQFLTVKVQFKQ